MDTFADVSVGEDVIGFLKGFFCVTALQNILLWSFSNTFPDFFVLFAFLCFNVRTTAPALELQYVIILISILEKDCVELQYIIDTGCVSIHGSQPT